MLVNKNLQRAGSGERKVRSGALPCLVSPFLMGNPSKGEPQVEHLFKTAGSVGR